jgi:PAS domain S-box-containing protein
MLSRAPQQFEQSRAEIDALQEGSKAVLKYPDFFSSAKAIFNSCKKIIGAKSGYIALASDDGKENVVLFLDAGGLACTVDPNLPMPIRGLRGQVFQAARVAYDNDFSGSRWMKFIPEGHVKLKNVLFAPLINDKKVVGLLGFANKRGGFMDNDARLAAAFGDLAAIALMNKKTVELLRRTLDELEFRVQERTAELEKANDALTDEIAEHQKAEKSLRDSESRYRIVADNTYDWEFWMDPQGEFIYTSPSCKRITGYEAKNFQADPQFLYQITHPDDRPHLNNHQEHARQKREPDSLEFRIIRPDGTVRWIDHICQPVFDAAGDFRGTRGSNRDITERKQAEEALRESEVQLRALSSQIMAAQEIERKRISSELHDELGQALTLIKLRLRFILENLSPEQTGLKEECENNMAYVNQIIENVRRISQDLNPSVLDDLGISAALRWLIKNFVANHRAKISHDIDALDQVIPPNSRIILFRILQEALTNVEKHSRAENVSVLIKKSADHILFSVEDDGKGFDSSGAMTKSGVPIGLGLKIIAERVKTLGGTLDLRSQKGKGTKIAFRIPLRKEGYRP